MTPMGQIEVRARRANVKRIRVRFSKVRHLLNERDRRIWAAKVAAALGWGGIAEVCRATGLAYETVARGRADIDSGAALPPGRVRRSGAGPKRLSRLDPTLKGDFEALIDPATGRDPESPLRWTSKTSSQLASELRSSGHRCSETAARGLLDEMGYRRRASRRLKDRKPCPDRDGQFEHVTDRVKRQLAAGEPVIVVDTKRRESIRVARTPGREWRLAREGLPANVRAFMTTEGGQISPDDGDDVLREGCWENAGISHDTAAHAAGAVDYWWCLLGRAEYPRARTLLVIVDEDGGDAQTLRLWKLGLQDLADKSGLSISVCHLPPGATRWTRLKHRLFSFASEITDGGPRLLRAAVVSQVVATPVAQLPVRYGFDRNVYRGWISATAAALATVRLERGAFHGDWNYRIRSRRSATPDLIGARGLGVIRA